MNETVNGRGRADVILARVRAWRRTQAISDRALAERIGVSAPVLGRLYDDDFNPTLAVLRRLESCVPDDFSAEDG